MSRGWEGREPRATSQDIRRVRVDITGPRGQVAVPRHAPGCLSPRGPFDVDIERHSVKHSFLALAALAALHSLAPLGAASPSTAFAQDAAVDGFAWQTEAVSPPVNPDGPFGFAAYGVARTLSNGDVVTFDGLTVLRVAADGTPIATLGALPAATFPGCIAIDPTETYALVGESSTGEVFRAELDGSGMTLLANLPFNYDATFAPNGDAYVSANLTASFSDNNIVRLDTTTGAWTSVAFVTGPSGPISFDASGHLYYAHNPDPGVVPTTIVVFMASDLALGTELTELDAFPIATGFGSPASLVVDPGTGAVYLAENETATDISRIVRVVVSAAQSPVVVQGQVPFNYYSNLELTPSSCAGQLGPYQPSCGGRLRYCATDFFSTTYRAAVEPARPTTVLTGPGAGPGIGAVTLELAGGPPSGFALVFFGPTSSLSLPEVALPLPGHPPLLSGLAPGAIDVIGGLLPLDVTGALQISAYDPGLDGQLTVQALCFDDGGATVGTTTASGL